MTPTSTQNLNAKLSPPAGTKRGAGIGISWSASAIQSSGVPVLILGSSDRYRGGGYRITC